GLAEGPHVLAADGEEEAALERGYVSRSIVPEFLQGEKRLTAAERGTAYHCVMEHIPFEAKYTDAAEVKRFIEDLAARRILGEAEAAAVEASRIAGFFRSDIGKRALAAKELRREAPFVMKHMHAGREVMVQGTIDCYFEEDGAFVLIDYKSNYVDRESPQEAVERLRATYLPQLSLYREALEKICGKEVKEAVLYLFSIGKEVSLS
ncbi:MAG: PD-(D/E)XK nuclease family protein, partial [Firmicutes bacterium]|nr:PD-(D/E)XK nuclease family protein [Bacillota bacterium]